MAIRSLKTGQFSRSALVGNPVIMPGSYESIATVNGTGSATFVEFTNIPNTYTHLQVRGIIQPNNPSGGGATFASMRINGDTGNNYTHHYLRGDGASVTAVGGGSTNYGLVALSTQGNATNVFTGFVMDILDYANTNKNKTVRTLGGYDNNGSGNVALISCLWLSTNAITSIRIFANDGLNLNVSANAKFALYGVN
jgi:hypothetical protein